MKGYTLIELMIVVAIVGILASVAIPKISNMIAKSKDATTLGSLATLRSALSIYYADTGGYYPAFPSPWSEPAGYGTMLESALVPSYLDKIPEAKPSGNNHVASNLVYQVWHHAGSLDDPPTLGHGWTYDANPWDDLKPDEVKGLFGTLRVLCKHPTAKGTQWSSY